MICFPLEQKPDWRRPPLVTILLIFINICCFLFWQLDDNQETVEAVEYYFESDLPEIELPAYEKYIEQNENNKTINYVDRVKTEADKNSYKLFLFQMMRGDGKFLNELAADSIIKPVDKKYWDWRKQREIYDKKLNEITYYRYGLKPYQPSFETLITSMFLHGGFGHLIGNMIFLFLFGFAVEMILGWKLYLPAYLFGGLGSGLFNIAIDFNSAIPGIGASGAIAALAGMYTVLFGLRKIRFFCFFFVYFDTFKLPALTILPVWVGYEMYLHYAFDDQVNNLAHLGGYITGAIVAFITKQSKVNINEEFMDENLHRENYESAYQEGQLLLAAMKFDKARMVFRKVYEQYPDNNEILKHLFDIEKSAPESDQYHRYACALLALPKKDVQTVKMQNEVFRDYASRAKPGPRLNPDILLALAMKFAANNYMDEAEKITGVFLKKELNLKEVSDILMLMIKRFKDTNPQKAKEYLAVLTKMDPEKASLIQA